MLAKGEVVLRFAQHAKKSPACSQNPDDPCDVHTKCPNILQRIHRAGRIGCTSLLDNNVKQIHGPTEVWESRVREVIVEYFGCGSKWCHLKSLVFSPF